VNLGDDRGDYKTPHNDFIRRYPPTKIFQRAISKSWFLEGTLVKLHIALNRHDRKRAVHSRFVLGMHFANLDLFGFLDGVNRDSEVRLS